MKIKRTTLISLVGIVCFTNAVLNRYVMGHFTKVNYTYDILLPLTIAVLCGIYLALSEDK